MGKRIDIYTAGDEAGMELIGIVKSKACSECRIEVHEARDEAEAEAMRLRLAGETGVHSLPAVVMDGKTVDYKKFKK